MITRLFLAGLTSWPALNDTDYVWLLADDTWTPDPSDQVLADVVGELTDGSYGRVVLTGSAITSTVNTVGACIQYDADDPTFASLGGTDEPAWLVLGHVVADDSDSPLLGCWPVAWVPNGTDFTPTLSPAGIHQHNLATDAFWTPT